MLKEFFIINMVEKSAEKLITHAAKTSFNKHKSNNNRDNQGSITYNTYNTEIYNENPVAGNNTVSLVCAHCGGTMTVDKDSSVLKCPYCGSTELIHENDNVKIAKIKNDTKKEIELKKMEYEDRERERKYEEKEKNRKDTNAVLIGCLCFVIFSFVMLGIIGHLSDKEAEQPTDPTMAAVSMSSSSFGYENYQAALNSLQKSGFTNITCEPVYDIYFGIFSSEGKVAKISINNITEFDKNETFPKDAEIIITYHLSYEDDPNYTETTTEATYTGTATNKTINTQSTTTESKSLFYSTNDNDTAKDGNTGVFSYKSNGGQYSIYYIIDFDEGYVYRFIEGNGDETCERLKIDSGDLNNGIIITYHDGNDTWSNGLHFEKQRISANLVLEDNFGFKTEFDCTNLKEALRIKDKKKIIDY